MNVYTIYQPIYDEMRERNIRRLRESGVVIDASFLSGQPDMRRGIGLFAFIEQSVPALDRLIAEVSSVFADQVCYTLSPTPADTFGRIHFTFFQYIKVDSIPTDFSEQQMKQYAGITRSIVESMPPLTIEYKGVMAIPTGLLMYGYPSYDVNPYREQIREQLADQKIPFVEPYKSNIVHSTLMRIATPMDAERLIAFADRYKDTELFQFSVSNIQLCYGSWRMRNNEIAKIHEYNL